MSVPLNHEQGGTNTMEFCDGIVAAQLPRDASLSPCKGGLFGTHGRIQGSAAHHLSMKSFATMRQLLAKFRNQSSRLLKYWEAGEPPSEIDNC